MLDSPLQPEAPCSFISRRASSVFPASEVDGVHVHSIYSSAVDIGLPVCSTLGLGGLKHIRSQHTCLIPSDHFTEITA